ncbi:MAG: SGNH/GDSL hydrolase family protein [Acidobacteriota bacterium]
MKKKRLLWVVLFLSINCACFAANRRRVDWVGSWAASLEVMRLRESVGNSTIRDVVHVSLGGTAVRVTLTNQFGTAPLRVGAASIALSAGDGRLQPGSERSLTFNHQSAVSIPAGSYVLSDPIAVPVRSFADLAVSIYLPQQTVTDPTCHQYGLSTNYIAAGDETAQNQLQDAQSMPSWCFLQSVDVRPQNKDAAAVVTLGDSITDGAHSTVDANHRYPDYLAVRLQSNKRTAHLSVLNEGISGGRVLFEGHGPSALQRFDRDVLAEPGVRYVLYLEGINDIGQILRPASPENALTADDLIFAATQLVTRAHEHGVKVFGATLLPFEPRLLLASPGRSRALQVLEQYNDWVRTSHVFDGVVDLHRAIADPKSPQTMLPAYDSGDHVHPNDAGYKAMADAIDLSLFR